MGEHAPRIRREAIVFRGPPDKDGPMVSTRLCAAKAVQTRATQKQYVGCDLLSRWGSDNRAACGAASRKFGLCCGDASKFVPV